MDTWLQNYPIAVALEIEWQKVKVVMMKKMNWYLWKEKNVKETDWNEAVEIKQEADSKDRVMHIEIFYVKINALLDVTHWKENFNFLYWQRNYK